ncbi:MAG: cyclic nucleotide-binding domain-containing protein [Chloroflexota bacterium]
MTSRYSAVELSVPCTLFTRTAIYSGDIGSHFRLMADTLNNSERVFFSVTSCTVRSLVGEAEIGSGNAVLRKESIIAAFPAPDADDAEEIERDFAGEREVPAVVIAGQLVVHGTVKVPRGPRLPEYLAESPWSHIPVLNARVAHELGAFREFRVRYVLISRTAIDAVLENVQVGPPRSGYPANVRPFEAIAPRLEPQGEPSLPGIGEVAKPTRLAIDAESAQRVLLGTDVFDDADPELLLQLADELTRGGGISQLLVPAGAVVLKQGDEGDTLYIVQRGRLDVLDERGSGEPEIIAGLRMGEVFGEMAFLGNRRRTATVRATSEALLLVLTARSWKEMAAKLPNVTGKLMRVMAQRGGSSGGLLGRR